MAQFEYKVVPAPVRGEKVKGVKLPEARFAHTVEGVLNDMARDGWEFVRAELLPSEERSGLSRTNKEWRNLLIFRRAASGAAPVVTTGAVTAPAMEPIVTRAEDNGPPPRANTPPVRAKTPENRARALARQVRGPAEDDPMDDLDAPNVDRDGDRDGPDSPFEIKSVDEAAEEGPFKSWRERS